MILNAVGAGRVFASAAAPQEASQSPQAEAPADHYQPDDQVVKIPRRYVTHGGVGAAVGAGGAVLMGYGFGGAVLGATVGGAVGAVLADTGKTLMGLLGKAGSYLGGRYQEWRFERQVAHQAEEKFQAAVSEAADQRLEELWSKKGKEAIEARVEQRVESIVAERVQNLRDSVSVCEDVGTHRRLADQNSTFSGGFYHLRDGLEVFQSTEGLHSADRMFAEQCLELSKGREDKTGYYFLDQALTVVRNTDPLEPASLQPALYLRAINGSGTYQTDALLYQAGLKTLRQHGDLSESQNVLCDQALANSRNLSGKAAATYLEGVMRTLRG